MGDEVLDVEVGRIDRVRGGAGRSGRGQAHPGVDDVHHHKADGQRDQRGPDEPAHGLGPHPAHRRGVLHVRHAGDQGGDHQGGDDHLDQLQESEGDDTEIAFPARPGRIVGQPSMEKITGGDPRQHGDDQKNGETAIHAAPGLWRPAP